ncbi:MAG: hypothetical protein HUK26_09530, partial [Duodenibacillus sp.]|nr:hypothetical protein [Duodenibacillus sp.]
MNNKTRLAAIALASVACAAAQARAPEPLIASGLAPAMLDAAGLVRESVDARLIASQQKERADGGSLWLDIGAARADNRFKGAGSEAG